MKSLSFPTIFNRTSVKMNTDYDATLSNLKLLLSSDKGELFGDPYYGTSLKKHLFDQNDVILQDILIDDIYTAICLFIPQIKITRKDIKIVNESNGKLTINITAINKADFTTDLYSIVLLEAEV